MSISPSPAVTGCERTSVAASSMSARVVQHHRFNGAAVIPVGDFVLHAAQWDGPTAGHSVRSVRWLVPGLECAPVRDGAGH